MPITNVLTAIFAGAVLAGIIFVVIVAIISRSSGNQ
jgi:uncharacterized protein (DUF2062 family)